MKKSPHPKPITEDPDLFDGAKAIGCLFLGVAILALILYFGNLFITNLR
jgi:hypothetical protein